MPSASDNSSGAMFRCSIVLHRVVKMHACIL
jgi:hypothetical protein